MVVVPPLASVLPALATAAATVRSGSSLAPVPEADGAAGSTKRSAEEDDAGGVG